MIHTFTFVALVSVLYLSYLLIFKCSSKELKKIRPVIAKNKTKQRVTAIRTGTPPGLYDNGKFVDNLERSQTYKVEELVMVTDS